jgi:hypothetical protein
MCDQSVWKHISDDCNAAVGVQHIECMNQHAHIAEQAVTVTHSRAAVTTAVVQWKQQKE